MIDIKDNIKCTMIKPPYKFTTESGFMIYDYHSAHTVINPNWKWWKPWTERFISVPAGWVACFSICGKIELDTKPDWSFHTEQPKLERKYQRHELIE